MSNFDFNRLDTLTIEEIYTLIKANIITHDDVVYYYHNEAWDFVP